MIRVPQLKCERYSVARSYILYKCCTTSSARMILRSLAVRGCSAAVDEKKQIPSRLLRVADQFSRPKVGPGADTKKAVEGVPRHARPSVQESPQRLIVGDRRKGLRDLGKEGKTGKRRTFVLGIYTAQKTCVTVIHHTAHTAHSIHQLQHHHSNAHHTPHGPPP